jgi:hypothetical protein
MPRKAKAAMVQEGSAHLDNKKEMTKAPTEKKHHSGTLMEGIVVGLTKKISPPIVDGIVRGIARHGNTGMDGQVSSVNPSATKDTKGSFGAGLFPEGAR